MKANPHTQLNYGLNEAGKRVRDLAGWLAEKTTHLWKVLKQILILLLLQTYFSFGCRMAAPNPSIVLFHSYSILGSCRDSLTWISVVFFNFLRVFYKSFNFFLLSPEFRFSFAWINYGDCICVWLVWPLFSNIFFIWTQRTPSTMYEYTHSYFTLTLSPCSAHSYTYYRMPNKFPYLLFKARLLLCREPVGSECMHENVAFVIMFSVSLYFSLSLKSQTRVHTKECIRSRA